MNYSKQDRIYFGIFNDGRLVFRVWNSIPKTDLNIAIAEGLCTAGEKALAGTLAEGDYLAFDYERR